MNLKSAALSLAGLLAAAGAALMVAGRRPPEPELAPIHPITQEMRNETAAFARMPAAGFSRKDTDGQPVDMKALLGRGPVFVIFIMDGCPCSLEAEQYFQRLDAAYGKSVSFLAITDGTPAQAKEFKAHFQTLFPIVSCPSKDLMREFGAKHSAYSALVLPDGTIGRLWPGYSQGEMASIDQALRAFQPSSPPLDFSDAPKKPTSGCIF